MIPGLRVRFAPAPTGYLHVGGARTALFNWLLARRHGGSFILRIEDTDLERSSEDAARQVIDAMRWLGLDWDEGPGVGGPHAPYFQARRRDLHLAAARRLLEEGRAFECFMPAEELEARRERAIAEGRPFRYEGWHRRLTDRQKADFRAEGRRPAIRLLVEGDDAGYVVDDLVKGRTHFPRDQVDDFVLVRSDGTPSFHLANVVDDADMRVTHVIRGEDHLVNTCRHQLLFRALGLEPPRYGHLPMILGPDRAKLSKRHGAVSVLEYRRMGYLPDAMVNELALLGWSPADGREELSREELIERFDLSRCGHSGSIFDVDKLNHLNRVRLKAMTVVELDRALREFASEPSSPGAEERDDTPGASPAPPSPPILPDEDDRRLALLELVRDELTRLDEWPASARRVLDRPDPRATPPEDPALARSPAVLEAAENLLSALPAPWPRDAFKAATKEIGKVAGAKGKELFMPLRVAITGSLHGPALDGVAAVLGRDECLSRIREARRAPAP